MHRTNKWQQLANSVNFDSTHFSQQYKKIFYQRLLAENLLVFLLQYAGLSISTLSNHFFPVWFATGSACAFIFLRGNSILPGVWLGSLLAFWLVKIPFWHSFACAIILTGQVFFLFWGSCRFIRPTLLFVAVRLYLKFIFYSVFVTGITAFLLQWVLYSNQINWMIMLHWWLANMNGILIFSFPLIALDAYFPQISEFHHINKTKLVLWFALLLLSIFALVMSRSVMMISLLSGSAFLFVTIIAAKYQWCGTMLAVFLLGFLLSLAAYLGLPLFAYSTGIGFLMMKIFLVATAIFSAILAICRITI